MHVFDFFAEFTATATRAWAMSHFALPPTPSTTKTDKKPAVHDLSFDLQLALTPSSSSSQHPSSSSKQPTAVEMPLELILLIIEASYDHTQPDVALLKSCSLVCRAWSTSVQKLLFRKVTLQNHRAFTAFRSAVDPSNERGAILGAAVRDLRVVVDHSQPAFLSQRAMAEAVSMCPNLDELDLSIYGFAEHEASASTSRLCRQAPAFEESTLALLRSGPQIKSLNFSNWSENHHTLFQLLDVWPSISSLSLSGTSTSSLSDALPVVPFKGTLEHLRINFQTPPSVQFMGWLLHTSIQNISLRSATFEREPSSDLVHFLIDSFGSSLHALSLPNCGSNNHNATTTGSLTRQLAKCEQLRFMRIDQPQINAAIFKSLPMTLGHLAIGVDRDTPLQPVIDLVKARSGLERVTVRLWNGGEGHKLLSALKIACAYRGVELMVVKDAKVYRALLPC